MSYRFSLNGDSSVLEVVILPAPIYLDENLDWGIALIGLVTYNTIPNVDTHNQKLYYFKDGKEQEISIPEGSYEISALNTAIRSVLGSNFALSANNSTLKTKIYTKYKLNFLRPNCINSLLGFNPKILDPDPVRGNVFVADQTASISHVNSIRLQCNLVTHSYTNGEPDQTLHEFYLNVEPGYKIIEVPASRIYLPINTYRIDRISIRLVDDSGNLLNFRSERISIALHLRGMKKD